MQNAILTILKKIYRRLELLAVVIRPANVIDPHRIELIRLLLKRSVNIDSQRRKLIKMVLSPDLDVEEAQRMVDYACHPAVRPISQRYLYQKDHIRHVFAEDDRVLDVGSGNVPFPFATILADRYLEPTRHRTTEFQSDGKPVVICDIHALPFARNAFDYSVCAHVLEHVDDPIQACKELQRVSKAGFIETPALMNDALFAWAKRFHKWHVNVIAGHLVFFEYSERLADGIRNPIWHDLLLRQNSYHPFQNVFNDNQDIFNTVLEWQGTFAVTVFDLAGNVRSTGETEWAVSS